MATSLTARDVAEESNIIGSRAGHAFNVLFPDGKNRVKNLARLLNCSLNTVKNLLAGQHWTIERLEQVAKLRPEFYSMVFTIFDTPTETDTVKLLELAEVYIHRAQQLLKERS